MKIIGEKMVKTLIVYETQRGITKILAEYIGNEIKSAGFSVDIVNIENINQYDSLGAYGAFIFGSATVVGDMMPKMKAFLGKIKATDMNGKIGGAFGTFGCCGKGPMDIYTEMDRRLHMDMTRGPLIAVETLPAGIMRMGHEYGCEVVEKIKNFKPDKNIGPTRRSGTETIERLRKV